MIILLVRMCSLEFFLAPNAAETFSNDHQHSNVHKSNMSIIPLRIKLLTVFLSYCICHVYCLTWIPLTGRELGCLMGQIFHIQHFTGEQTQCNAPAMENVERRSCLSDENFPYLPVLLERYCSAWSEQFWRRQEDVGVRRESSSSREGKWGNQF